MNDQGQLWNAGPIARIRARVAHYDARRSMLWAKYRLTPLQYDTLLIFQGGGCAVCGKTRASESQRLHVDHDHSSQRVRGILCYTCNAIAGHVETGRVAAVITYLNDPPFPRMQAGERD